MENGEEVKVKPDPSVTEDCKISPWDVTSVEDFLYYCCPECDLKSKDSQSFIEHAIACHNQLAQFIRDEPDIQDPPPPEDEEVTNGVTTSEIDQSQSNLLENVKTELEDYTEESIDFDDNYVPEDTKEDITDDVTGDDVTGETWQCYACAQEAETKDEIKLHCKEHFTKLIASMYGPPRELQCHNCRILLRSTNAFENHKCGEVPKTWRTENTHKRQKCIECDQKFPSFQAMLIHSSVEHPNKSIQYCDLCDYKCATSSVLALHRQKHFIKETFPCDQCDYVGSKADLLYKHRWYNHRERQMVSCEICKKQFKTQLELKRHIMKHTQEKPHKCDMCDYSARTSTQVKFHKKKVHSEFRPHVCHICGKGFMRPYDLKSHMESMHNEGGKSYMCDKCGKSFQTPKAFKIHVFKHQMFHMCTVCERVFCGRTKLRDHLAVDHQIGVTFDEMFICHLCHKKHKSSSSLDDHLHSEHKLRKDHFCLHCDDKSFSTKAMKTLHMIEVHEMNPIADANSEFQIEPSMNIKSADVIDTSKGKSVVCDICNKIMSSMRTLVDHKRQYHTDSSKHYKCDQCDYHTFEQYRMKKHKAVHDPSLRFACDKCDVTCSSKPNLRRHIRTVHEGIKPVSCSECGKSYEGNRSLAMHLLREHNILYKYKG